MRPQKAKEKQYFAPYFVDYFKQWFLANPAFGPTREDRYRLLFTGGLRIVTTLDPSFQRAAETAVRTMLSEFGEANRQTMMAQVVNPEPVYDAPMEASGDKAVAAIERYRTAC